MTEIERLRRADEVVQAALACGEGEWPALLERECGADERLRAEVESLLGYRERARAFIETPAAAFGAALFAGDDDAEEAAGRAVGPYRIVRELGRGGMGAVYLAERSDGEFEQRVALKVARRSFADADLRRRFRQERQILASLNHPNIARLLDGGVSADGEPYLVMEYVEGERVDDYCEARRLSTRARLRLFLGVCRGVSYAHRHLVVHRDIKPGNILVTPEGVPKLLDFGIAKLLGPAESGEQTLAGMRAFTPDYAAPEQMTAGGHITTATDVYSLGVLLGDLLGGSRRGRGAAGRRRHGTPARTVATNLPTDQDGAGKGRAGARKAADSELDNIVAMARREDPARRYATADELADDVGRYLEGRPVRAQKDSLTYRAGKFVRRNRAGVAAAALAVASLVAGLGVAVWQARAAARERDRAERRFDDVRQLSNALLSDIAPKIERLPGSTHARQSLVGQSLKYLDSLAGESADDRVLQAELASAYEKVGASQGAPERPNLGDYPGAVASYRKAQSIRRRLLELDPADAENRRRLAASYNDLAAVLYWTNDYAGALEAHAEALRLYESLAAERPADLRLRLALAETRLDLGQTHSRNQRYAEAFPHLRAALASLEEAVRAEPGDTEARRLLAKGHTLLAAALSWSEAQAEAEAEMAKAVEAGEALVGQSPNDVILRRGLWFTYLQASSIYEELGDAAKDALSEEYARKALRLVEGTLEKDPADVQARQNLAQSYSKLAVSAANRGKLDESARYVEGALAIFAELERGEPNGLTFKRNIGIGYTRLGIARHKQGDLPRALEAFERSAASFDAIARSDAQNMVSLRDEAQAFKNMARIHEEMARGGAAAAREAHLRAARENYQRALDLLLGLQSRGAFAQVDREFLEEMRDGVRRLR